MDYLKPSGGNYQSGEKLYKTHWLLYLRYSQSDDLNSTYYRGNVRAEYKKTSYMVDVHVDADSTIIDTQCEFPAGSYGAHLGWLLIIIILNTVGVIVGGLAVALARNTIVYILDLLFTDCGHRR